MAPSDVAGARPNRRKVLVGAAGALAAGTAMIGSRAVFETSAALQGLATRSRAGVAFQTSVALTLAGRDAPALDTALAAAFAGLRAVERASSLYRFDSDLSRLNRTGMIEDADPHLTNQMRYAVQLAAASGGLFDPTVQPLWTLWADHAARGARPDSAALRQTLRSVDWTGLSIDGTRISFDRPGMQVTLNSLNQGYAADVVLAILADRGIDHAFVDTGEFGARGVHPDGRGWRLGVAAPRDTTALAFTLTPFRRFAATSGDYETFFSADFRDHHIFDPRSGLSPPDWSAITVSAATGMIADGLSTALFIMNEEEARRFLSRVPDTEARFFDKRGRECMALA